MGDCVCFLWLCRRGKTAVSSLMKSRPRCFWELWIQSSSSRTQWWVELRFLGGGRNTSCLEGFSFTSPCVWQSLCRVCIWAAWSGTEWTCAMSSASACAALPSWLVHRQRRKPHIWHLKYLPRLNIIHTLAGVCLRHPDRMAPHLQRLLVLRPVGAERPAAVGRLALRGGRHGQLVRQSGVCGYFLSSICLCWAEATKQPASPAICIQRQTCTVVSIHRAQT